MATLAVGGLVGAAWSPGRVPGWMLGVPAQSPNEFTMLWAALTR